MTLEITHVRRELVEARNLAYRYKRELEEQRQRVPLLVSGLIDAMPPVGQPWSSVDRDRWIETMRLNLCLLYDDEPAEAILGAPEGAA